MTWLQRQRLRRFVRASFWLVPVVCMAAALDTGVIRDASGELRLVYRTPDWEDFVTLAAAEIRLYGAQSPQVTRRLSAMFEHLLRTLPAERGAVLRGEAARLQRTAERAFDDPEDRALALHLDLQGFGSHQTSRSSLRQ